MGVSWELFDHAPGGGVPEKWVSGLQRFNDLEIAVATCVVIRPFNGKCFLIIAATARFIGILIFSVKVMSLTDRAYLEQACAHVGMVTGNQQSASGGPIA